jgi:hypothetical protein
MMAVTCPRCLRTTFNPNDEREGYCGYCYDWTGTPRAMPTPVCFRCGKTPDELPEYFPASTGADFLDPIQFVIEEEGTYNPANGHFCCTDCYLAIGMPTANGGWKAP